VWGGACYLCAVWRGAGQQRGLQGTSACHEGVTGQVVMWRMCGDVVRWQVRGFKACVAVTWCEEAASWGSRETY
jgi:hypothetical protein